MSCVNLCHVPIEFARNIVFAIIDLARISAKVPSSSIGHAPKPTVVDHHITFEKYIIQG